MLMVIIVPNSARTATLTSPRAGIAAGGRSAGTGEWRAPMKGGAASPPREPKAELLGFALAQPFEKVLAAQRDIAVVAADFRLRARRHRMPFFIDAEVHRRLAPAFA